MVKFIPVRYAHTKYPDDIKPKIQETTAKDQGVKSTFDPGCWH